MQLQEATTNYLQIINFDNLSIQWLNYLDTAPRTKDTYTKNIKQFLLYLQQNEIYNPERQDILNYKKYLMSYLKPTTAQNYLTTIKVFFNFLEYSGLYPDITKHIKGVKIDPDFKKDYLTIQQENELLKTIDKTTLKGLRDYAIIKLAITTGLRVAEITTAQIKDLRSRGSNQVLFIQGKGRTGKAEFVNIPIKTFEAIKNYLKERGENNSESPLFASISNNNNSGMMTTRSTSRIIKEALKNAGFVSDRLTAHSLRHSFATNNLILGGTPEETKNALRHRDLNTTLKYLHNITADNNQSQKRIDDAITE